MPFRPYLQEPEWTWLLVLEMTLAGLAAGAYVAYALLHVSRSRQDRDVAHAIGFLPLPLLVIVAVILIIDLGQPLRFLNLIFTSPSALPERGGPFFLNTASPLSWGTYVLPLFGLFALLAFIDSLAHAGRLPLLNAAERVSHHPVWLVLGSILAMTTAGYSGVVLNVTQQTVWTDTVLIGALYLAVAVFGGLGVAAIIAGARRAELTLGALRDALLWVAAINVVLLVLFFAVLAPNGYWQAVAFTLTTGPVFWIGLVVLGLVAPIVLLLRPRVPRRDIAAAGWLSILAGVSLRYTILFSAIAALHG
jgi:formate-dependent nitrite reductase membrane component NrfD